MDSPFLRRIAAKGKIGHGNASEARIGKSLAARMQPASGAISHSKSDMLKRVGDWKFRIESKSTVNTSLPLDLAWLTKISKESLADASIPAVTLSFVRPDGNPRSDFNSEWVALPKSFFHELLEALECPGLK